MTLKKGKNYNPARLLRLSDEVWEELRSLKPRGLYWNGFILKLIIAYKTMDGLDR